MSIEQEITAADPPPMNKQRSFETREAVLDIDEVIADLEINPSLLDKPGVGQVFDMIKNLWDETSEGGGWRG